MKSHEVRISEDDHIITAKHGDGMYLEMMKLVQRFDAKSVTGVDCRVEGSQLIPIRIRYRAQDGMIQTAGNPYGEADKVLVFVP